MKRRLRQGAKLIVADPRRIDLVRTPHIEADYHLQLRPGTNVALINSLAHVIVTEGLVKEDFVRARCEAESFEKWRDFVAQPKNSPEAMEAITGVPASDVRAAARLYATGGQRRDLLRPRRHRARQGSTMVMGIANLAMATGNIGREGVGVNPLRGQNNVQGSCDMGSFPHEFTGLPPRLGRHGARAVRGGLGRDAAATSRACAFRTCSRPRSTASSRACTSRARTSRSPIPNTQHVTAALTAMECIIVQDLFLNESAKFAHVFLPGSSFLEKDGTFTNAERRISRVRKVMRAEGRLCRLGDHAAAVQRAGLSR